MHIIATGQWSRKVVLGTEHNVISFVGINDSGKVMRTGIGLLFAGSKPESTLVFQSTKEVNFSIENALVAMMILENVKWVTHLTLSDCLHVSKNRDKSSDEVIKSLSESLYSHVQFKQILEDASQLPAEQIALHEKRVYELLAR